MARIQTALYRLVLKVGLGQAVVNSFHTLYYDSDVWVSDTRWLGRQTEKCPLDLWIYQEIIFDIKPDIIIETGTYKSASALFLASICDLVNRGRVITIDIVETPDRPNHDRIEYIVGSSVSEQTVGKIQNMLRNGETVMVILDSDHSMSHVLQELRTYSRFVSVGSYLIVEDTDINGHPVVPGFGPGPMEAVDEFLRGNANFIVDKTKEKFQLTQNPKGYLLRVR